MTTIQDELSDLKTKLARLENISILRAHPAFNDLLGEIKRFRSGVVEGLVTNHSADEKLLLYTQGVVDTADLLLKSLARPDTMGGLRKSIREKEQQKKASEAGTLAYGKDVDSDDPRFLAGNQGR